MTIALAGLFNDQIIENIISFYNPCPEVEWEQVYGSITIYRTNHLITYGGGPEGGLCYLFREHEPGWYRWERNWGPSAGLRAPRRATPPAGSPSDL